MTDKVIDVPGFTQTARGELIANLGKGLVVVHSTNWEDGSTGVSFSPLPDGVAPYTDFNKCGSGLTTDAVDAVFSIKCSTVRSLLVVREALDHAIAELQAKENQQ